jgi:hypothetical protein
LAASASSPIVSREAQDHASRWIVKDTLLQPAKRHEGRQPSTSSSAQSRHQRCSRRNCHERRPSGQADHVRRDQSLSEPVDAPALLTEIAETIGKYVIMDPHQRDAAALGAVFAHTHDLRDTAPSSSLFRRRSGSARRGSKRWIANESSDRRHIRSCRHAEIITRE